MLVPAFSSCKGIGDAAVDEIFANRPYDNVEEFLWNEDGTWRHSKLNKRAVSVLIQLRAFETMNWEDKFTSYKHFHDIVIDNWDKIRKSTKREPDRGKNHFRSVLLESESVSEWTMQEIAQNSLDLIGTINTESIMQPELLEKLKQKDISSIDDFKGENIYWAMITGFVSKKTRNKKPYLILSCLGTTGKTHRVFCWNTPENPELKNYNIFAVQLQSGDYGYSTRWQKLMQISGK